MKLNEAKEILCKQEDFLAQKSMLQEAFDGTMHESDFLPKFHCELNPIENVWGEAKRYAWARCDYSFQSLLRVVPEAIFSEDPKTMRRFFRRNRRFIEAYGNGDDKVLQKYMNKQYTRHRRPLASLDAHIDENTNL